MLGDTGEFGKNYFQNPFKTNSHENETNVSASATKPRFLGKKKVTFWGALRSGKVGFKVFSKAFFNGFSLSNVFKGILKGFWPPGGDNFALKAF